MKNKIIILLSLIAMSGCRTETGRRLFDMNYLGNRMTAPGVLNTVESHFFSIGPLETRITSLLTNNSLQSSDVSRIDPYFATLTALDGTDLSFIDEISVRICPVDDPGECQAEIFYRDDIPFRPQSDIELLPALTNAKEFILDQQSFRIQVVLLRLRDFSPANIELQFDFGFEARGE